jgi:hypothetical protein
MCAAMWHGLQRWPYVAVPCDINWGEVDLLWPATWYYGGAHLSGDLCSGGTLLLTWTDGRVPRGTGWELL